MQKSRSDVEQSVFERDRPACDEGMAVSLYYHLISRYVNIAGLPLGLKKSTIITLDFDLDSSELDERKAKRIAFQNIRFFVCYGVNEL